MPLPDRVRLVVIFGGRSAEHDVSCVSAYHVLRAVDADRYEVRAVGITRDGRWVDGDDAVDALVGGTREIPGAALEAAGEEIDPLPVLARADGGRDAPPTVVLPLVHGPYGEDGTLQGMLELAGVPYVGAGVLGSALCMDKLMAKQVLGAHGVPQVRHVGVRAAALDGDLPARVEGGGLEYPVFVKPANMGSSVGVTKVEGPDALADACLAAAAYDEWVVVEEGVRAREVEVGVLGGRGGPPRASVPGEIVPSHDFYDYEDKYLDGTVELVVPAELPEEVATEAGELAGRAFELLRCDGMARVDFFFEEGRRGLLLNEVNTIPGFTPGSMFPRLWDASGITYAALVDELVALALDRHARRARRSTTR